MFAELVGAGPLLSFDPCFLFPVPSPPCPCFLQNSIETAKFARTLNEITDLFSSAAHHEYGSCALCTLLPPPPPPIYFFEILQINSLLSLSLACETPLKPSPDTINSTKAILQESVYSKIWLSQSVKKSSFMRVLLSKSAL